MIMFPRHRMLFASMLFAAGSTTASPAPSTQADGNGEDMYQPLDQAAEERWLAYVNEMLSHRR